MTTKPKQNNHLLIRLTDRQYARLVLAANRRKLTANGLVEEVLVSWLAQQAETEKS